MDKLKVIPAKSQVVQIKKHSKDGTLTVKVMEKAVEDLGLNGNALIPGVCQQGLGDTVKAVLFRFVAVVVVQIQI
mgnify:CR=1 FL=1